MGWPPEIPRAPRVVLADAAVPCCLLRDAAVVGAADRDGLVRVNIAIAAGRIERVDPAGTVAPGGDNADANRVRLDGCHVWPCLVDMHAHLDKSHIWPRTENPDGTF